MAPPSEPWPDARIRHGPARRWALWAAVLGHGALGVGVIHEWRVNQPRALPERTVVTTTLLLPSQALPPPPLITHHPTPTRPVPTQRARPSPAPALAQTPPPATRAAGSEAQAAVQVPSGETPAAAVSGQLLLNTSATQQAIELAARSPSLAAAASSQLNPHGSPPNALGAAMQQAVMTECLKGDPNEPNQGGGLLALPGLLLKAAAGKCAR